MLFGVNKKKIKHMPHKEQFDLCRARMSQEEYDAVLEAIHAYMEGKEVFDAGYIPGSEWTGTPYEPISRACGDNFDISGLFFGQLVWEAVMEHPDSWCFIRQESRDDQPIGMTYFRKNY